MLICTDLTNDFLDKNGPQLAAAIAYFGLFSLFPLFLAVVSLLGFFLDSDRLADWLVGTLGSSLPLSQDSIDNTVRWVVSTRHITGTLGFVGLLWTSTTVFGAIRKGVNTLWGIKNPRPFFHERLLDVCFTAGAGLLMVTPLGLTAAVGFFGGAWETVFTQGGGSGDGLVGRVITFLSPVISLAVFMCLYRYLPNTKVTFREVWPGAVMAAIAFEVAKAGFLWYAHRFPIQAAVYGPVGGLAVLLTWVYVSALILLYGAMVTSRYSAHLSRKVEEKGHHLLVGFRRLIALDFRREGSHG